MNTPKISIYSTIGRMFNEMVLDGKHPAPFIREDMEAGKPIEIHVSFSKNRKTLIDVALQSGDRYLSINFKPEGSPFKYQEEGHTSFLSGEYITNSFFKKIGKQQLAAFQQHLASALEQICQKWKVNAEEVVFLVPASNYLNSFTHDAPLWPMASDEVRYGQAWKEANEWFDEQPEYEKSSNQCKFMEKHDMDTYRHADMSYTSSFLEYLRTNHRTKIKDFHRQKRYAQL